VLSPLTPDAARVHAEGPGDRRRRPSPPIRKPRLLIATTLLLALLAACVVGRDRGGDESGVGGGGGDDFSDGTPTDSAIVAARQALAAYRPWRALDLLAPALADSARRTPAVRLVAAEASAAVRDWRSVERLLAEKVDSTLAGDAALLLTRAALGRGDADRAATRARRAIARTEGEARGAAWALLGRALDRRDHFASARGAYDSAAAYLPDLADWLRLRAAGVTRDDAARRAYYEDVEGDAPRARLPWSEAATLERLGRPRDAARAYETIDSRAARVAALRLRAATARGARERAAARREVLAFLGGHPGDAETRAAIAILDAHWRRGLPAREELAVARLAAANGQPARAAAGYARAARRGGLAPADRLEYARILARLRRRAAASRQLALVRRPGPLAAAAAYERARLLVARRRRQQAATALRAVVRAYPKDTAAALALFELAELASERGRDRAARDAYLTIVRRYPESSVAPRAAFEAALVGVARRRHLPAALELDSLLARWPASAEADAATYWSGRAWRAAGDTARARERWAALVARDPRSYYGVLAARRLGVAPWAPTVPYTPAQSIAGVFLGGVVDTAIVRLSAVDGAMARADHLDALGFPLEARLERESVTAADAPTATMLAAGVALLERGLPRQAMEVGRRLVERGDGDVRSYRLLFPVPHVELITAEAAAHGVDPTLVAAVIRQESSFDPRATSTAGARGLMQMMPRVARAIARAEDIAEYTPALLYRPEANVRLGVTHLKGFTEHYDHPARALAAYNAGPGRVARWSRLPGARDAELFVERIPFAETRGYVRTVMRNWEMYRALYAWEALRGAAKADD
jgi:soluble lytic murein transglycosylase